MEKSLNSPEIPKWSETNLRNILDEQALEKALAELAEKGSAFVHLSQEHHIPPNPDQPPETELGEPTYFKNVYDEKTGKKYVLRTQPKVESDSTQLATLEELQKK